jgi:hypothetical protein
MPIISSLSTSPATGRGSARGIGATLVLSLCIVAICAIYLPATLANTVCAAGYVLYYLYSGSAALLTVL